MEMKTFTANEPVLDQCDFVGAVIVQDDGKIHTFGDRSVNHAQELVSRDN